jgi:anti-sigma regulatory factor (Ser/Thr protein kinase)
MSTRTFELASDPSAAGVARRAVDEFAAVLEPQMRERVHLLVTELVTNSIRHAELDPGDPISLTISVRPHAVQVAVGDGGPGFGPPTPALQEGMESGWGFYLVDQIADSWGVLGGVGTRVWFEIRRERSLFARAITRLARRAPATS